MTTLQRRIRWQVYDCAGILLRCGDLIDPPGTLREIAQRILADQVEFVPLQAMGHRRVTVWRHDQPDVVATVDGSEWLAAVGVARTRTMTATTDS